MALSPVEEAQTRALIAQEAPLLSLAGNEATITSKLGATKVNLSQLPAATTPADSDIYLVRQGTTDKSVAGSVLKPYFATSAPPAASETVVGITRFSTDAESLAGTLRTVAVDPANLAAALATVSPASVQGAFKNLAISTTGTSASVSATCDEIVVENAANAYKTLRSVSLSPSLATVGANGLDTGTSTANMWYSVWIIWNGTTTSGLLSLSATAPTMPAGYTYKAWVGAILTDGTANKYPIKIYQRGRKVKYTPASGTNLANLPRAISGVSGTPNTTLTAVPWGAFAPPMAVFLTVNLYCATGTLAQVTSSPLATYGFQGTESAPTSPGSAYIPAELPLESANIYYASSGASSGLDIAGWEYNL